MLAHVVLISKESLSHGVARYEHGTRRHAVSSTYRQFPFLSLNPPLTSPISRVSRISTLPPVTPSGRDVRKSLYWPFIHSFTSTKHNPLTQPCANLEQNLRKPASSTRYGFSTRTLLSGNSVVQITRRRIKAFLATKRGVSTLP